MTKALYITYSTHAHLHCHKQSAACLKLVILKNKIQLDLNDMVQSMMQKVATYGIDTQIIKYIRKGKIIVCECVMIFINFVQNQAISFNTQHFADIITSVTASCQGHTIRYKIFIKIIKTSDYYIVCCN